MNQDLSGGVRVTVIGAIVNIALAVIKFIAGTVGNSAALMADAIHSISDLATDIVVYISIKISGQKPDAEHPYGHGRAETIGSAIIGAAIFFVGFQISWKVLQDVFAGEFSTPKSIAFWAALVSIAGKEAIYRYTLRVGKNLRSESIIANAWHHRSDALSSVAAAIGIGGAALGWKLMDPLAAVLVGLMVVHVGGKIFYESLQNLMDIGVSPEALKEIEKLIKNSYGVKEYHELKTRKLGRDTFVDVHIQVQPRISISEAHNIAESVRHELREKIDHVTDALVHIDAEDDREGRLYNVNREEIERDVTKAVQGSPLKLSGEVTLHYFINRICVEITLDMDESLSAEHVKKHVEELAQVLLENSAVTEVSIKHSLGRFEKNQS